MSDIENMSIDEVKDFVDKLEKENAALVSTINFSVWSLEDTMYQNRGYEKCMCCLSMKGYAHQSYCHLVSIINRLKAAQGGVTA